VVQDVKRGLWNLSQVVSTSLLHQVEYKVERNYSKPLR
jgi:hypothetical protein